MLAEEPDGTSEQVPDELIQRAVRRRLRVDHHPTLNRHHVLVVKFGLRVAVHDQITEPSLEDVRHVTPFRPLELGNELLGEPRLLQEDRDLPTGVRRADCLADRLSRQDREGSTVVLSRLRVRRLDDTSESAVAPSGVNAKSNSWSRKC